MTIARFPSVFRRQRPLSRTLLRSRRKTAVSRRGEFAILETLEQRLAMTSNAAIGADLVDIMGRDIRFEGLFNRVSQKWFWTNPAAGPSTSAGSAVTSAQPSTIQAPSSTGDWIIRLNSDALSRARTIADVRSAVDREGFGIELVAGLGQPGLMLVRSNASATATTDFFRRHTGVAMFERNDSLRTSSSAVVPSDPDFQRLYGLNNLGQTGGIVDADIDAPEAWATTTGSRNTVVGVIDTGIDLAHRDLYRNIWISQTEIPATLRGQLNDTDADGRITFIDLNHAANAAFVVDTNGTGFIDGLDILADGRWSDGIDTDGNGFADDFFGWDFVNNDNNPSDDHNHGTHVAGTIGATANDGTGVAGVNWTVSMMGLKFLSSSGSGSTAAAIRAINYATMIRTSYDPGLRITNNSWGGGGDSQSLKDAIDAGGNAGILFVAAAGNSAQNTDVSPMYPAAYPLGAIVSVAATDSRDAVASFSNVGLTSVDLGAPGASVWSTVTGNRYASYSGTSMASPHVAGAAALALAVRPSLSMSQLKDAILATTDPVAALAGRTVSGGRLNAATLVESLVTSPLTLEISARKIQENAPIGTIVGALRVVGESSDAAYAYQLVSGIGGADNGSFMIEGSTLRTTRALDFEARSSLSVRIRATDATGSSFERMLSLSVENVNEAPTAVVLANVRPSLPENTPTFQRLKVADVVVRDDALGTNTLSLAGPDAAAFEISGTSLFLRAGSVLNRAIKPNLSITINARDLTLPESNAVGVPFTLTVAPAEISTRFVFQAPGFETNGGSGNTIWRAGHFWAQTFATSNLTSMSRMTLTMQFASTGGSSNATLSLGVFVNGRQVGGFGIPAGTAGSRSYGFSFSPISGPSYRIEIRAMNSLPVGGGNVGLAVNGGSHAFVTGTAVANRAPIDIALSSRSVPENSPPGFLAGFLNTLDPDSGESFTYTLVPGVGDADNNAFRIVGNQLLTTRSFDFESRSSLSVRIRTTDRGGLSFEKPLAVRVADMNEAPTRVSLDSPLVSLPENTDTSSRITVGSIRVDDDALGANVISLTGPDAGSFEVDKGILYLKAGVSLDYERQQSLAVRVAVADPTLPSSAPVTVDHALEIIDIAEPPRIIRLTESTIVENRPVGSVVGGLVLAAADDELPPASAGRSDTRFELVSGEGDDSNQLFAIDGQSLLTNAALDYEQAAAHSLRVRAIDAAGNVTESIVFVDVADENEAPEELLLSGSTIRENMPTGTLIGELQANDPDGDAVSYELVSNAGGIDESIFAIVGNRLIATRPLDFESGATRTIRVRAVDDKGASNEAAFMITVLDANDAPHEITLSNDSLAENLPAGAVVGSFATADADKGARHVYRLVAGQGATDNSAFRIIGNQLRAARSFDFETKSAFSIRVRSTDEGGLSIERTFTIRVNDVVEDAAVVRLSRISGEGYARLVQGGIMLQQGQTYRFSLRMVGDVKLHPTDHIPEFWGQGVIFGGQTVRTAFRDGWTTLEASVTASVSGIFELKLALWSLQEVRLTGVSLRSLASGAELVRNGSFGEGLRGWYTHGGAAGVVGPVMPPAASGSPWAAARRPTV